MNRTSCHDMETFSPLLTFVRGIHRSTVDSPEKKAVTRSYDVSLMLEQIEQIVEQTLEWQVIWYTMMPMWRLCNEADNIIPQGMWRQYKFTDNELKDLFYLNPRLYSTSTGIDADASKGKSWPGYSWQQSGLMFKIWDTGFISTLCHSYLSMINCKMPNLHVVIPMESDGP